jgi:hypothetical protein
MRLRRRRSSESVLRTLVERRAHYRCEYCHTPQQACGYRFHLDHVIPQATHGGHGLSNRALACASCNLTKTDKTSGIDSRSGLVVILFNPRKQAWSDHFRWMPKRCQLVGLTSVGRATISALALMLPCVLRLDAFGSMPVCCHDGCQMMRLTAS